MKLTPFKVACAFCGETFVDWDAQIAAARCWNHECCRCKEAPKHFMPDLDTIQKRLRRQIPASVPAASLAI